MDIIQVDQPDLVSIDDYAAHKIVVNGQVYQASILVGKSVHELPENWQPEHLTITDFQAVLEQGADVILVGTGQQQKFLSPQLAAQLAQYGMGLECMNTAAACRTFMLLQSEGRQVFAWLLV